MNFSDGCYYYIDTNITIVHRQLHLRGGGGCADCMNRFVIQLTVVPVE